MSDLSRALGERMLYHYYCKSVVILLYHFDWTLLKATNLKLSIHSVTDGCWYSTERPDWSTFECLLQFSRKNLHVKLYFDAVPFDIHF